MIEMPYRGATAKDVEKAILIPIEEALEGVKGIEQLNADGYGGTARLYLRAAPGTDLRAMLEDVKVSSHDHDLPCRDRATANFHTRFN